MSTFYLDRESGESETSQWRRHLQNQSYIADITKSVVSAAGQQTKDFSVVISQQTKEMNDILQNSSKDQAAAIEQSTKEICGTLKNGFELLSGNLEKISSGIGELRSDLNNMASMLDWNFSLLIEQQMISNLLLGNIAILLRIPEIQKERQYYLEQGMKFLKNAMIDPDFFDDSLNYLLKAEKIEPTDYFTLHRIGFIYMYSPKHLELDKALDYFRKAARYGVVETNNDAGRTNNYLEGDLNYELSQQVSSIESIKRQVAETYFFLSKIHYIKRKFQESADYAGKGYGLAPKRADIGFMQAKALAANGNVKDAVPLIEKVISSDRFFSLTSLKDPDLCHQQGIHALLNKLHIQAKGKATGLLNECRLKLIPGSKVISHLAMIEKLINQNSYLTSMKAIDLFDEITHWPYCEPFENPKQADQLKNIITLLNSLNDLDYYYNGNNNWYTSQRHRNDIYYRSVMSLQWRFKVNYEPLNNSNWKANIYTINCKGTLLQFIESEKHYNDLIPSTISYLKEQLKIHSEENPEHPVNKERRRNDAENWESASGNGTVFGIILVIIGIISIAICYEDYWRWSKFDKVTRIWFDIDLPMSHTKAVILILASLGVLGYLIGFYLSRSKIKVKK